MTIWWRFNDAEVIAVSVIRSNRADEKILKLDCHENLTKPSSYRNEQAILLGLHKSIVGIAMNKVIQKNNLIKAQGLIGPGFILTLLSLSVAACVEQLAKLLLLLG